MTRIPLTREEYVALLASLQISPDGMYSLEVPDHLGPKARDDLPAHQPAPPLPSATHDEETDEPIRKPSSIIVPLGNFIYRSATGEAEYETEDDFENAFQNFTEVRNQRNTMLPIKRLTGGQFKVAYKELYDNESVTRYAYFSLKGKPAKVLECVIKGGGICSRFDVIDALWTEEEQMKMKSKKERALYPHVTTVNKKIEQYRLYIDLQPAVLELKQL